MRSYQIAVAPGATLIADSTVGGGPRVVVSVPSTAIGGVYLGGDENQSANSARLSGTGNTLTSSTGFLLAAGASREFLVSGAESLYGISALTTVTITVHVMRTNARYA